MSDATNPDHYKTGEIECIDALKSALGVVGACAFCRGNAIKYLWRAGHKDDRISDLRKALWYIGMELALRGEGDDPRGSARGTGGAVGSVPSATTLEEKASLARVLEDLHDRPPSR
tara:strand:- start:309 stop:656 length:348 start_codon:yes stop_codon:yes gene_type:complete